MAEQSAMLMGAIVPDAVLEGGVNIPQFVGGGGSGVPIMSEPVAGIAKVGDGLRIDAEGRLSVDKTNNEVNNIILIDREDEKKYVVYVSGGALMMEEYRSGDDDENEDGEEGGGGDGGDSVDRTIAIVGKAIVGFAIVGKRGI
jgi:hypothetical protein